MKKITYRRPVRDCSWLLSQKESFSNITAYNFICTSDPTRDSDEKYNCIAWVVGRKDDFWWPSKQGGTYWPLGLDREQLNKETVANFRKAFELEGFTSCENSDFEDGYEKIALYVDNSDVPKHAARSLPTGTWTSKLGDDEDIEHFTLNALEGRTYGTAKYFFKRANPLCQKANQPTT